MNSDTEVTITAVDSARAVGTATIKIIDNGVACGAESFAISPFALTLNATATVGQAVVTGGSGTYLVSSANPAAVTAAVAGSVVTLTRVAPSAANPVAITVRDSRDPSRSLTLNVTVN